MTKHSFLIGFIFFFAACSPTVEVDRTFSAEETVLATPAHTSLPLFSSSTNTPKPPPVSQPALTVTPLPTAKSSRSIDIDRMALKGLVLSFWHPWYGSKESAIDNLIDSFNAENEYGVTISGVSKGDNLSRDIKTTIALRSPPDLTIGVNNQLFGWDGDGNILVDIDNYISDPVWGLDKEEIDEFNPVIWAQDVLTDKRYGFPIYHSTQVMFYNQSWASELGFDDPPSTPSDFKEQACSAASSTIDGTGGWVVNTNASVILSWVHAFQGNIVSSIDDGYNLDNPQIGAALVFLKELFDNGCAWRASNYYPNEEFASRKALFITSSVAGIPGQSTSFSEMANSDTWVAIPFPSISALPEIVVYGPSYAIFQTTDEKQLAAWVFIKWLAQPEYMAYWVENSDYLPAKNNLSPFLNEYSRLYPQWAEVYSLSTSAFTEPKYASWGSARWTISDAADVLFGHDFDTNQIPQLLQDLNTTAAEIHIQH